MFPPSSWAVHPSKMSRGWNDSIGGKEFTFYLNEEGGHATLVGGYSPDSLWFYAPFQVIEAQSE